MNPPYRLVLFALAHLEGRQGSGDVVGKTEDLVQAGHQEDPPDLSVDPAQDEPLAGTQRLRLRRPRPG